MMARLWKCSILALALLATAPTAIIRSAAADLHVMSSGGLTAAFKSVIPIYEAKSGDKIELVLGPSMGTAEDAIPIRLKRGEPADLLLMVGYALDDLVKQGVVERKLISPPRALASPSSREHRFLTSHPWMHSR